MSLLVRSQLRFVRHAPWSAATALLGVALGVASVVAVHLISADVVRSLEESAPPHLRGLTHVLERHGLDADGYFDLRERWRRQPDSPVTAMVPVVEGRLDLGNRRVQVLGADWLALPAPVSEPDESPLTVTADVLLGAAVLADPGLGYRPGDVLTIGGRRFEIAAVREMGLGDALVADIAAAQWMLGVSPAAVQRIGLAVADPWAPWRRRLDALMPGIAAGLPGAARLELPALLAASEGWRISTVSSQRPAAEFARAVLFNLGALGTLALLVAWFLIYQVGVIWLRRQHLLLERLHAIGVSHRALLRSFLVVFLGIGALATLIGTGLGLVLADLLTKLATEGLATAAAARAGFRGVDGWLLAKALGSGLGVCLFGGLGAFAREWRERQESPWWRVLAPLLVLVLIAGIVIERSGVLGGFLAIFALSLLGVATVSPALALLRRLVARIRGPLAARLALRDVAWYPRMVAVALAALSLAVATSIGIGLMVESFRFDFQRMLDVRLAGDLYLDVSRADPRAVRSWLDDQPEVARQRPFGRDRLRVEGVPVELGYGRFDAAESGRYGYPRPLAAGEALVSERLARDLGIAPGATVELDREAPSGVPAARAERSAGPHGDTVAVTVVGTFSGFGDPLGRLLVDVASLGELGIEPRYDRITVHLTAAARGAGDFTARLTSRFPDVSVEPRAQLRAAVLRVFDRTFAITQALTLVALLVAVVGTYNALTALRLHQARTTALLRAQGMTAAAVRRIALLRAGIVGGVAMILALPLGLGMAWVLCAVINPRSFGWTVELHLPTSAWLPPLALGVAAALAAGALPAPRERGSLHEPA